MIGFSILTVAGLLGAAITVSAYLVLQLGYLSGQGYYYAGLNALGAGLVLVGLTEAFNLSSAIMQGIWITVSVVGITRYYILTHTSRLTPDEQAFREATVPGLNRIETRRLLNLASWDDVEAGTRLTEEGETNTSLYYLLDGKAEVRINGTPLAELGEHNFIGDMSLETGEIATATVELTEPGRYVAFPVKSLNRLLEQNSEIRRHLKAALSGHLVGKLMRTNHALLSFRE